MKQPATILVVEDESSLLEVIVDLLQVAMPSYEVRVLPAGDGETALRLMDQETPDLIISDVMMPRMDGHELLKRVRERIPWVHIPFVFLTAKGKRQDVLEGRRLGAELYITKPFSSVELIELVESQLQRTFELRALREKRLSSLKRDILQILNHDFRTPLTYVTAYYEMLADGLHNLEEANHLHDYLKGIQNGSLRLTHLIQDLIQILELRTGEMAALVEREAEVIDDVGDILVQAGRAREQDAKARQLRLDYKIADDLPPVYGHRQSLRNALDRLIDNAVKFTPGKRAGESVIRLRASAQEGWVSLSVSDEGIGFPEYVASQLFEPFYQHNRPTLEQQGSGSGLAIARGVVELHNGRIVVESDEGLGSTFEVTLPAYQGDGDRPAMAATPRRPATILLVEDDRFLLAGLQELLEVFDGKYRLNVLTAQNGMMGLKMLEQHRPDLIISDVMMPVMDGYEFLHQVRQRPAWLQIPFIFLTARGEQEDIHFGLRSGVEEYIPKPYDVDELMHLVVTQLDRHFQMQGAVNQSFEELKRSILDLLQPDFMTPLTSVSEHSQKLVQALEEVQTDEDLKESLQTIQVAGERLTSLVEDFIMMAELKTGEAEANFLARAHNVPGSEVAAMFNVAAFNHKEQAEAAGITYEYAPVSELPKLFCDLDGLAQVVGRLFRVLLSLAAGREEQATLSMEVGVQDERLHFGLRLRGVAVPADVVQALEGQVRPEESESATIPAWGANLLVSRGIMGLHGGRLEVEARPENLYLSCQLPLQRENTNSG